MPPKNSGGSFKFPGGHKVFHTPAQTAFVRVVTPRGLLYMWPGLTNEKALKLRLGLGFVLKGILLQKPVFRQKSKFLELFHCSNIVLFSLLSLFNLQ